MCCFSFKKHELLEICKDINIIFKILQIDNLIAILMCLRLIIQYDFLKKIKYVLKATNFCFVPSRRMKIHTSIVLWRLFPFDFIILV